MSGKATICIALPHAFSHSTTIKITINIAAVIAFIAVLAIGYFYYRRNRRCRDRQIKEETRKGQFQGQ
jgi:hypothetical protein